MAFTITSKATGNGNTTGFTTASVAVSTGDLVVMFIAEDSVPVISGFSGLGVTWTVLVNSGAISNAAMTVYYGVVPSTTSGTVTVSWSGNRTFLYELVACTASTPTFVRVTTAGQIGGASSPVTLSVGGSSSPPTGWAQIAAWSMISNSTGVTINSFTKDTSEATWAGGSLQQRTTGNNTQLGLNTQWAIVGDSLPSGTFAWSAGTLSGMSAVVVLVREVSIPVTGAGLIERLQSQYTVGLGGFQPTRMIRTNFDMIAGANIPNLSGGPTTLPTGRDDVLGNPTTPSLRFRGVGNFGLINWPVAAGTRIISARVYYTPDDGASYRPQLIVRANSQIGIQADQVSAAPAGANAWQVFPTITVTIATAGVMQLEFKGRNSRPDGAGPVGSGSPPVFFVVDDISVI